MKRTTHTVTIAVEVWDRRALFHAAMKKTIAEGTSRNDYLAQRRDESDKIAFDLTMLLDPGMSPSGTEIIESSVEND